jgi:hypothetical protein
MGLGATVDWGPTATQAQAVKLEQLTIAVAPLGWDTNLTWLAQFQGSVPITGTSRS